MSHFLKFKHSVTVAQIHISVRVLISILSKKKKKEDMVITHGNGCHGNHTVYPKTYGRRVGGENVPLVSMPNNRFNTFKLITQLTLYSTDDKPSYELELCPTK